MFNGETPSQVVYCYGIYQTLYDDMQVTLPEWFSLHKGLPTEEELDEMTDGRHKLLILDDLLQDVVKSLQMERLFTQGVHHRNISIIFVSQNMYAQSRCARTINLQMHYIVLFRHLRDVSQVMYLGRQLYPSRRNVLLEAYRDCVKTRYGYIVIDLSPHSQDKYRLRSRIFPGEDPVIYVPRV